MKKQWPVYLMALLYLLAGLNHFRNPQSYYRIMPAYFEYPVLLNSLAGIAEIGLAILLLWNATRKWACCAIIAMLIAFIPVHIDMIQRGFCPEIAGTVQCAPGWILWTRLLILQPFLIWWAWKIRNR